VGAVCATALLAAAGCGGGAPVTVPDVVGLTGDGALERLCAAGLRPVPPVPAAPSPVTPLRGWTAYTPLWRTLSQPITASDPAVGTSVARGREVVLRARDPYTGEAFIVRGTCGGPPS